MKTVAFNLGFHPIPSLEPDNYFAPRSISVSGIEVACYLTTQVSLALDYARTRGFDRISFPFRKPEEKKIALMIIKAYREMGFSIEVTFPLLEKK